MRLRSFLTVLAVTLAAGAAAAAPSLKSAEGSAPVRIKDDRGAAVTLRVPLAIHRGANHFRLYGTRPLTLQNRGRRTDLYREVFLELATRSHLTQRTTAWDDLGKQVEWLRSLKPKLALPPLPNNGLGKAIEELSRRAQGLPGYGHLEALGKALGGIAPGVELPDSVAKTLQLRALATDEAESRLAALGKALRLDAPDTDPAMRAGYGAAVAEFASVRTNFWNAVTSAVRKSQGRLILSAIREVVLSPLGAWAIFGYLGWRGAESVFNAEYRGQIAICTATVAARLAEAARRQPEHSPLALYAEYALSYQLTEALRQDGVMALKPAGGRSVDSWQIELSAHLEELKKELTD